MPSDYIRVIQMRSYEEMARFDTFEERLEYLSLKGEFFEPTFGGHRWLNQDFYQSEVWRKARNEAIARDLGCDLGLEGHEIYDQILVHHINPLTPRQCEDADPCMWDLNNLVCVSRDTHNSIHYGTEPLALVDFDPRRPGDTTLWGGGSRDYSTRNETLSQHRTRGYGLRP